MMEWWQAIIVFLILLALFYAFAALGSGGGDPRKRL